MPNMPDFNKLGQDVKEAATKLFRGGRKGVDKLAVVIDERTQVTKLAARIRKLNGERSKVLAEIGKKVYTLHTRGKVANKDVLADCSYVDGIGDEISSLQDRIEEIRRSGAAPVTVEIEDETPLPEEPEDEASPSEDAPEAPAAEEPVLEEEPPASELDAPDDETAEPTL